MGFLDELPDKRLLPTQKNALAKISQKMGFSVDEFEWIEEDMWEHHLNYTNSEGTVYPRFDRQYRVSVLKQKRSGYFCRFGFITLEYSPAKATIIDKRIFSKVSERLALFRELLRLLKSESVPDMWGSLEETALTKAASSPALDNRPFTPAEQNLIAARLDEIKNHLLESQRFAAEQADFVEQRFEYLKESSRRMGRKDWLNVLYGGLITVVVGLALAPDATRTLLRLAAAALQFLWGEVQGYLP